VNAAVIATPTLDQIKQEIRAEAERQRAAPAQRKAETPEHDAQDSPPPDFGRRDYAVGELTNCHYREFVDIAYRAVLKRPPDPSGARAYLGRLAMGESKVVVLGSLRYSPEGRRMGVRIRGLMLRYGFALICKVPLLGSLFYWFGAFLALPKLAVHQLQSDAYFSARWQAVGPLLAQQDRARATLAEQLTGLESAQRSLAQRQLAIEKARKEDGDLTRTRIDAIEAKPSPAVELGHLRHEVLALKHWLTSLQSTIANLEQQESVERGELDALTADLANRLALSPAMQAPQRESYIAELLAAKKGTREFPLLDVGCGRGDWLELLKSRGLHASGIERNRVLADQCRGRGLDVAEGDLLEHLRRTANGILGALSALQVIEYLPLSRLVYFLDEAKRVLQPGGLLLVESFDSGTGDWSYRDPGCSEALAPEPLTALLESRGFAQVRLLRPVASAQSDSLAQPGPYALIAIRT
jgi:Methionine biosynthesis protein MetW/Domain of unknown function (DUF4214)